VTPRSRRPPGGVAPQPAEEPGLRAGAGRNGNGAGEHTGCGEGAGVIGEPGETPLAQVGVQTVVGIRGPGEVPRVDEHVLCERGEQRRDIDAGPRVVPHRRDVGLAREELRPGEQVLQGLVGHIPPGGRIVAGPDRLGAEGSQQEDVVEADQVLYDGARVPALTRRRSPPFALGGGDRVAEPPAGPQVPAGQVVSGHVTSQVRPPSLRHGGVDDPGSFVSSPGSREPTVFQDSGWSAGAAALAPGRKGAGMETRLQDAIRDLTDPMIVLRRLVDQTLLLVPHAEGAVVELVDGDCLTYVCTGGNLADHVGTGLRIDGSLSGLAVRTGQTLRCDDALTDPRVDRAACERVGAISMVCVPLRQRGEPIGALKVSSSSAHAFDGNDVTTLTRVAEFITTAIAAAWDMDRIVRYLVAPSDAADTAGVLGTESEFVANVLRPGMVMDVETRRRVERVLHGPAFVMVCQPVVDLRDGNLVGAEALARFHVEPKQPPDLWFGDAQRVGLGVDLELAAVKMALALLPLLPKSVYLAINVGPDAASSEDLRELFAAAGADRIVMELTEHLQVDDYPRLHTALDAIRAQGTRLAIDDAGAGFAGLNQILKLAPDLIKLDRGITTGVDQDPIRRALAGALVTFSADTGAELIAEGIETQAELETMRTLGVQYGQGYHLGRPMTVDSLPTSVVEARRAG
jgi:EAL domain-containing protein (putative c-di-GMP-specific phosphodiesterase class I)